MKQKKIFILAAAALAFAACSSDESPTAPEEQETGAAYTQGEVPVAFDAYVNRGTTRAGAQGTLTLNTDATVKLTAGFGVFGYYTDNKPYSETSIPNFMYNQLVTGNTEGTTWTYDPVKYWPNEFGTAAFSEGEDMLTFFAYAPHVAGVDVKTGRIAGATSGIVGMTSNTTTGDPYVKYAVAFNPTECVDLCWGVAKEKLTSVVEGGTQNTNLAANEPFIDVVKPKTDEKLGFQFYHALASLNVTIDADVDKATHGEGSAVDSKTHIWVRSITFEGFTDKGALNLNSTYAAGSNPNPGWFELSNMNSEISGGSCTLYDGRRDGKEGAATASNEKVKINPLLTQGAAYTVTAGVPSTDPYTGVTKTVVNLFGNGTAADDAPIFVIPTDEVVNVTIVYDVETYDEKVAGYLSDGKTKGSVVENKITKTAVFGDGVKMIAGKKYNLKLHLGMTSVKFEASVQDWDATPVNGEPWLPVNTDPVTP